MHPACAVNAFAFTRVFAMPLRRIWYHVTEKQDRINSAETYFPRTVRYDHSPYPGTKVKQSAARRIIHDYECLDSRA
eukprot:3933623-Rhodomonas_salina.1